MRDQAFYGMMPASISHEGYSDKPVHAYWDNFWALRGYEDAAYLASVLDKPEDAVRVSISRDEFAADLSASLRSAVRNRGINFLPGSVEHGDFDAISTAVALALEGERSLLPQDLLVNTFERYWSDFVERRDGKRKWKDYTPYEWRSVSAFVRLDWRNRVWDAAKYFLGTVRRRDGISGPRLFRTPLMCRFSLVICRMPGLLRILCVRYLICLLIRVNRIPVW